MGQCYCLESAAEAPRDSVLISSLGGKGAFELQAQMGIDISTVPPNLAEGATASGAGVENSTMQHDTPSEELKIDSAASETERAPKMVRETASVAVGKAAAAGGGRKSSKGSPPAKVGRVPKNASASRSSPPPALPAASAVRALQGLDKDGLIQLIVTAGLADAVLQKAAKSLPPIERPVEAEAAHQAQPPAAAVAPAPADSLAIANTPPSAQQQAAPVQPLLEAAAALRAMAADLQEAEQAPPKTMPAVLAVNKTASKLLARKARALKEPRQPGEDASRLSLQLPPAAAPGMAQPYELETGAQPQGQGRGTRGDQRPDTLLRTKLRFQEYSRLAALPDSQLRKEYATRGVPRSIESYPSRHTVCLAIVKHAFEDALPRAPPAESATHQPPPTLALGAPKPGLAVKFTSAGGSASHEFLRLSPVRAASAPRQGLDSSRISVSGSSVNRLDDSGFVSSADRSAASPKPFTASPATRTALRF